MGWQQIVRLGVHKSTLMDLTCGVPQGSILRPKLLILYINGVCKVSIILKCVLFADNTNIFCSRDTLQLLLRVITSKSNKLKQWFDRNKLSLNLTKTNIMFFGNRKIDKQATAMINNTDYNITFSSAALKGIR